MVFGILQAIAFSLVILTIFSLLTAILGSVTYRSFTRVDQPTLGPQRLSSSWTSPSVVSCASSCLEKHSDCWSYLYNPTTGLCTPGSSFNSQQPLPTADEGELYTSLSCTSKGLAMYTKNNTTACIGEFMSATYLSALESCQDLGGVLMSVRTPEKITILMMASASTDSWVGCDDLDNDGVYTWKEDNGALSSEEITARFSGSPTKQCIYYDNIDRILSSENCLLKMGFFCEIPLP